MAFTAAVYAGAAKMCEIPIKLVHLMALLPSVQKVPHCCTSLVTIQGCKLNVFDAYQGEVRAKTTQDMKGSCFVHLHPACGPVDICIRGRLHLI